MVSRDAWLFNRAALMPHRLAEDIPAQMRCLVQASDPDDVFLRLERAGRLLRIDPEIWPAKYRCATVSPEELRRLRTLEDVVRLGRVVRIDADGLQLEQGVVPSRPDSLYIDCTANGLSRRSARPIFEQTRITLQPVVMCQQVFSASLLAMVELRYQDDELKNGLCQPVPHPEVPADYFMAIGGTARNGVAWGSRFLWWTLRSRLSAGHHIGASGLLRLLFGVLRWLRPCLATIERFIEASEGAGETQEPPSPRPPAMEDAGGD